MGGDSLPSMILTGASGFIGRHVLEHARNDYKIYAMARRSRREARVPEHPNIEWIAVDLTDANQLAAEIGAIRERGSVDFVLHLAGYYDFSNTEHPAYEQSNVVTTRNMLRHARDLDIRRFILASSMTVTEFPRPDGTPITETSPADATFPYARAKRRAEEMVRAASELFPCSIVRLAAIFSDWCEYGPMYMLLSRWFSRGWSSRILAGHGRSAITYLHVECAVRIFLKILELSPLLKRLDTYVASPAKPTPQGELFALASRLYHGRVQSPVHLPVPVAATGIAARDLIGRALGRRPQERLWMMKYVDKQMLVDPAYSERQLPIAYRRRLRLERRLPYIVENAKSYPDEWNARNATKLKPATERLNLVVTNLMRARREELIDRLVERVTAGPAGARYPNYRSLDPGRLRSYIELVYDLLTSAVRSGERMPFLSHARYIGAVRRDEGFPFAEIEDALRSTGEIVIAALAEHPRLEGHEQFLHDHLRLTVELAIDEAEDAFEEARVSAERVEQ